jgi:hypothetical protein
MSLGLGAERRLVLVAFSRTIYWPRCFLLHGTRADFVALNATKGDVKKFEARSATASENDPEVQKPSSN